jgi:hypothetical protein
VDIGCAFLAGLVDFVSVMHVHYADYFVDAHTYAAAGRQSEPQILAIIHSNQHHQSVCLVTRHSASFCSGSSSKQLPNQALIMTGFQKAGKQPSQKLRGSSSLKSTDIVMPNSTAFIVQYAGITDSQLFTQDYTDISRTQLSIANAVKSHLNSTNAYLGSLGYGTIAKVLNTLWSF